MFEMVDYAQPLRAIGQALELLNVENFDLEPLEEDFRVRAKAMRLGTEPVELSLQDNTVRHIWGLLHKPEAGEAALAKSNREATTELDLRYSPEDLERLERTGQSQRKDPHGTANAASLSQLLRTIGGYLNQKRGRLLKISRQEQWIMVEFEASSGQTEEHRFAVADLYDVWVRMYMKRAHRSVL
jgi:hypothetical protein